MPYSTRTCFFFFGLPCRASPILPGVSFTLRKTRREACCRPSQVEPVRTQPYHAYNNSFCLTSCQPSFMMYNSIVSFPSAHTCSRDETQMYTIRIHTTTRIYVWLFDKTWETLLTTTHSYVCWHAFNSSVCKLFAVLILIVCLRVLYVATSLTTRSLKKNAKNKTNLSCTSIYYPPSL